MSKAINFIFVLGLLVTPAMVRADVLLVITTDANLNDNEGTDEFSPLPQDGTVHRIYIWSAGLGTAHTILEFNFDLAFSGDALIFHEASIGPLFESIGASLTDVDLNDLQFGWTAFLDIPPDLPECPTYTLLATLDLSIAPGTKPGPRTMLNLGGPDYRIASPGEPVTIELSTTGTIRNLGSDATVLTCESTCGDGVVQPGEQCDPPNGITCNAKCQRIPICGDGILDPGEECDDGGTVSDDGCDSLCRLEPLLNDDCSNAILISDGQTRYYTNDATTDGPAHVGLCDYDGQTYNDIWYDYVSSCTGLLSIGLCDSAYDTDLVVYDGCSCPSDNQALLDCNDDGCAGIPPESFRSRLDVKVIENGCYKIRVGGWDENSAGTGIMNITCGGCQSDDDCQDTLFCNGAESCVDGQCESGYAPCPNQRCDDESDACFSVGDVDGDGDVDLSDLLGLTACLNGPGNPLTGCAAADFDGDGDVDLTEFAGLQASFTGQQP